MQRKCLGHSLQQHKASRISKTNLLECHFCIKVKKIFIFTTQMNENTFAQCPTN